MKHKNDNEQRSSKIPENNPSKAMDSKKEVEQSPDPKTDQDFPGYPHYPAKEDIMDQRTDMHRVDMNVEELSNTRNMTGVSQRFGSTESGESNAGTTAASNRPEDDFSDINPRTEIGKEELRVADAANAEIGLPQNVENTDLNADRPGTDLEDTDTANPRSTDADVTREERMALENMSMPSNDEDNLRRASLDSTDFEGDELNEGSFGPVLSSAELDIPDETDETNTTAMGQGDEENKYYSLGGDRQDRNEEDPYSGPNRGNDA